MESITVHVANRTQSSSMSPPMTNGLNGVWRSDDDYLERKKMITKIVLLWKERRPKSRQELLKKSPHLANQLELALYLSAGSFEEYKNTNTLVQRLQQLAVHYGTMEAKNVRPQQQWPPYQDRNYGAQITQRRHQPQQALAPGQPPQEQTHFPQQGLSRGDKDYEARAKMITKIVLLMEQRKPNASQEWLKKLPSMAKRLEESLYRSAKSFEEYSDASTLEKRLQQLAVNIERKTKEMQQQQQHRVIYQQPPHLQAPKI